MNEWADRVARAWSAAYTLGLDAPDRERRLEEIRCDLHEHRAALGASVSQQVDVARRIVLGIPADLAWRTSYGWHRAPTSGHRRRRVAAQVMLAFVAVFDLWSGVGIMATDDAAAPYAAALLAAGMMGVAGLMVRPAAPAVGTVLVMLSATVPTAVLHWMAPIFVPLCIACISVAIATRPRPMHHVVGDPGSR